VVGAGVVVVVGPAVVLGMLASSNLNCSILFFSRSCALWNLDMGGTFWDPTIADPSTSTRRLHYTTDTEF